MERSHFRETPTIYSKKLLRVESAEVHGGQVLGVKSAIVLPNHFARLSDVIRRLAKRSDHYWRIIEIQDDGSLLAFDRSESSSPCCVLTS